MVESSVVRVEMKRGLVSSCAVFSAVLGIVGGTFALIGFIGLSVATGGTALLILGTLAALGAATTPALLITALLTLEGKC